MSGVIDFLDGKKTIIAGVLVSLLGGLPALGVHLPFAPPDANALVSALGAVVVLCRLFAKKPGALASVSK